MNYTFVAASALGDWWARLGHSIGEWWVDSNLYAATVYDNRWTQYLQGLLATLQIAVVACVLGVFLGIVIAMVKTAAQESKNPALRFFNFICNIYTTVIRGTPQVLQLLILYGMGVKCILLG